MLKTRKSELSSSQNKLVNYIEDNWEGSEFYKVENSDDIYYFTFIIPKEDDLLSFLSFVHREAKELVPIDETENYNIYFEVLRK